jgi:spore coat polysaccharide biosynthesis protein SpsF (cytidylyltransferase family)
VVKRMNSGSESVPSPVVTIVIQARLTSTRLPGKVLAQIGCYKALDLMIRRLRKARFGERIVVAVPDGERNSILCNYVQSELGLRLVVGPEDDVLSRFRRVADQFPSDYFVRLTADCPLICPEILDAVVGMAIAEKCCASNIRPPTFADGFDVECLTSEALYWLDQFALPGPEREHVTLRMRSTVPFRQLNFFNPSGDHSSIRLTLDTARDLEILNLVARHVGDDQILTVGAAKLERLYRKLGVQN